jgi:hypothetical protein
MSVTSIPSAKELLENHRSPTYGISTVQYAIIKAAIDKLDKSISNGMPPHNWCVVSTNLEKFTPKMEEYMKSLGYAVSRVSYFHERAEMTCSQLEIRIPPSTDTTTSTATTTTTTTTATATTNMPTTRSMTKAKVAVDE